MRADAACFVLCCAHLLCVCSRSASEVQALSHRAHDQLLYGRPVMHHLPIPHTDDGVATQAQLAVVGVVAVALCADVSAAVDLEHESVPDEEIDAMAV